MWVKTLCLGETVKKLSSRAVAAVTNGVLALVLIVVGCVCFFPSAAHVSSGLEERVLRRGTSSDGVSLMFNVYWGTEEVDGILSVLEEYEAQATFFIGGSWADDNADCVRRIAAAGHVIGSHGYFHRDHTTLGYEDTVNAAQSLGLKTILWSKDTVDWRDKDEDTCYLRATKDVSAGEFVLMHPMPHTLAALPRILEFYREQGLRAVTVGENLGLA